MLYMIEREVAQRRYRDLLICVVDSLVVVEANIVIVIVIDIVKYKNQESYTRPQTLEISQCIAISEL